MKTASLGIGLAGIVSILSTSSIYAAPITYIGAGNSGPNPTAYTFTATGSGEVGAYFVGETAGFGSIIGMSVNGGAAGPFGLQNHSSSYGDFLDLGPVSAGDVITFVMEASATNPLGPTNPGEITYTWYSDPGLNSDGANHIYSSAYGGDSTIPAGTYVGFEDLPDNGGSDHDYDDHQFVFTGPFQSTTHGLPDGGSTLAMLGLSSLGMMASRLRRK